MKRIRRKVKIVFWVILSILIFSLGWSIIVSKYSLETTVYEVDSGGIDARIVLLTDVHGSEFGADNERLIQNIGDCNPDIIMIAGDLINSDNNDLEDATQLISNLSSIAPVYISFGNQEAEYIYDYDIKSIYEDAGAVVVEFGYVDVELNSTEVRIGGFYGYGFPVGYETENELESEFLRDFEDTDSYKILLAHMPHAWYYSDSLDYWDIDLVLSGHIHGGQVIIPFIGALYVPDRGFFPGRIEGISYSEDNMKTLIISRGLGTSHELLPRINNVPEIVVVDLY